jgi:hypothetical protein
MSAAAAVPPVSLLDPSIYDDDPLYGFKKTSEWSDASTFTTMVPPETMRSHVKSVHIEFISTRTTLNPTDLHQYTTLVGRYVVDGTTFEETMNDTRERSHLCSLHGLATVYML